jgi:hypothetical protein
MNQRLFCVYVCVCVYIYICVCVCVCMCVSADNKNIFALAVDGAGLGKLLICKTFKSNLNISSDWCRKFSDT